MLRKSRKRHKARTNAGKEKTVVEVTSWNGWSSRYRQRITMCIKGSFIKSPTLIKQVQYFIPFKRRGVKLLHFGVFRAILV